MHGIGVGQAFQSSGTGISGAWRAKVFSIEISCQELVSALVQIVTQILGIA
jgi:hypothetical protein